MKVVERFYEYLENSHLKPASVEKQLGFANGYLGKMKRTDGSIGSNVLEKILVNYPDLNLDWLLTGDGEMIRDNNVIMVNQPVQDYSLRTDRRVHSQEVPLYDINASAGLLEVFDGTQVVIDTLHVPNLPKCDGSLIVTGHSMYPEIQSGDIVAYKFITDLPEAILFGESYLVSMKIDGEWTTVVKYVQKSEKGDKYVLLVSENKHHSPKDIKLENIRTMAHIKGVFRIKSMA